MVTNLRCVVMSADMVPTGIVPAKRALKMYIEDKAYILEEYPDKVIRTVDDFYPVPSVVCLKKYVNLPNFYYVIASLSPYNLKIRDAGKCQYCGRKSGDLEKNEYWTRDHIMPVSRGGENRWENVVLACNTCNNKKGDRTPEESEMPLLSKPRVPSRWHLELLKKRLSIKE